MKTARAYRFVWVIALSMSLLGCAFLEMPWFTGDKTELLTIEYTGGLCPYGPCYNKTVFYSSGMYENSDGAGVKETGDLGQQRADELRAIIEASDFDTLTAVKFTGECPSAQERGQEIIYTFYRRGDAERISACVYVIDYGTPLFRKVNELIPWFGTPTPQFVFTVTPVPSPSKTPTLVPCTAKPRVEVQQSATRIKVGETVTLTYTVVDVGMANIAIRLSTGAKADLKWSNQYANAKISNDDRVFQIVEADGARVILRNIASPGKTIVTIWASGEVRHCEDGAWVWGGAESEPVQIEAIP
jgi:hypothetical protein